MGNNIYKRIPIVLVSITKKSSGNQLSCWSMEQKNLSDIMETFSHVWLFFCKIIPRNAPVIGLVLSYMAEFLTEFVLANVN